MRFPTARQPGSNQPGTHGIALLDGLEYSFGESIDRIARQLRRDFESNNLSLAMAQLDDFLLAYNEQVGRDVLRPAPPPTAIALLPKRRRPGRGGKTALEEIGKGGPEVLDHLQPLDPGDNRPILRRKVGDKDGWGHNPRFDPVSALLYSHDIVLLDSLAQMSPDNHKSHEVEGLTRDEWLVRSVEQYAYLAPSIRAGLVEILPCSDDVERHLELGGYPLGEIHTREWERETGRTADAAAMRDMVRDLLLKVQVTARSPGMANALARPGLEEQLVGYYFRKLHPKAQHNSGTTRQEEKTVARLVMLRLNGISEVNGKDLVDIRQETVFSEVRSAIASAVTAALEEEELASAQEAARSTFEQLLPSQKKSSAGVALTKAILPKTVSYGVGTYLASTGATWWQTAIPIAIETAGSALMNDRHDRRARRAQRGLYVALSTDHHN